MKFKVGDKIRIVKDLNIYQLAVELINIHNSQGFLLIKRAVQDNFDNSGTYYIDGLDGIGWVRLDYDAELCPFAIEKPRKFEMGFNYYK